MLWECTWHSCTISNTCALSQRLYLSVGSRYSLICPLELEQGGVNSNGQCILATLPLTFRPFEITLDRNSNICRRQVPAKTLYECRISKLDNPTALRCTEKFLLLTLTQSAPTCSFRSRSLSGTDFPVPQVSPCACQTIHLKHWIYVSRCHSVGTCFDLVLSLFSV